MFAHAGVAVAPPPSDRRRRTRLRRRCRGARGLARRRGNRTRTLRPLPRPTADPAGRTETPPASGDDTQPAGLQPVAATADPQAFAESVARALFDWDTTAAWALSDYTGRLLAVADPTGQESPGLVADIAGYLPTAEAWAFLKPYYTRQWLEISSVEVPDLWDQALAEAGPRSGAGDDGVHDLRVPATAPGSGRASPSPPSTRWPSPSSSSASRRTRPVTC